MEAEKIFTEEKMNLDVHTITHEDFVRLTRSEGWRRVKASFALAFDHERILSETGQVHAEVTQFCELISFVELPDGSNSIQSYSVSVTYPFKFLFNDPENFTINRHEASVGLYMRNTKISAFGSDGEIVILNSNGDEAPNSFILSFLNLNFLPRRKAFRAAVRHMLRNFNDSGTLGSSEYYEVLQDF